MGKLRILLAHIKSKYYTIQSICDYLIITICEYKNFKVCYIFSNRKIIKILRDVINKLYSWVPKRHWIYHLFDTLIVVGALVVILCHKKFMIEVVFIKANYQLQGYISKGRRDWVPF